MEETKTNAKFRKNCKPKSPRIASDQLVIIPERRAIRSDGKKVSQAQKISFEECGQETDDLAEGVIVHNPYGLISTNNEHVDILKYMEKVTHGKPIKSSPTLGRKNYSTVTLNANLVPKIENKEREYRADARRSAVKLCRLDKPQQININEDTSDPQENALVYKETRLIIMDRGLRVQYPYTIADVRDSNRKHIKRVKCEDGELYCIYGESLLDKFLEKFLCDNPHQQSLPAIQTRINDLMKKNNFDDSITVESDGMMVVDYSSIIGITLRMFYMLYMNLLKKKLENTKGGKWTVGSIVDTYCKGLYEIHQSVRDKLQRDSEDAVPLSLFIRTNHLFIQFFLQCYTTITAPKTPSHFKMTTL